MNLLAPSCCFVNSPFKFPKITTTTAVPFHNGSADCNNKPHPVYRWVQ